MPQFLQRLRLLKLLEANDGASSGSNSSEGTSDSNPNDNKGDSINSDNKGQKDNSGDKDTKNTKTFTQAEVNAMMKKEKESGRKSILKELGVEDAKSAKEGLTKYKEYLDSQKSEAEKQAEALKVATENAKKAEQRATAAEAKMTAMSYGVNPKAIGACITIALGEVSDDKSLEDVLKEMKENPVYSSFFTKGTEDIQQNRGTGKGVNSGGANSGNLGKSLASRLAANRTTTEKKSSFFSR